MKAFVVGVVGVVAYVLGVVMGTWIGVAACP
jgi:hypothetical protein